MAGIASFVQSRGDLNQAQSFRLELPDFVQASEVIGCVDSAAPGFCGPGEEAPGDVEADCARGYPGGFGQFRQRLAFIWLACVCLVLGHLERG